MIPKTEERVFTLTVRQERPDYIARDEIFFDPRLAFKFFPTEFTKKSPKPFYTFFQPSPIFWPFCTSFGQWFWTDILPREVVPSRAIGPRASLQSLVWYYLKVWTSLQFIHVF